MGSEALPGYLLWVKSFRQNLSELASRHPPKVWTLEEADNELLFKNVYVKEIKRRNSENVPEYGSKALPGFRVNRFRGVARLLISDIFLEMHGTTFLKIELHKAQETIGVYVRKN